jgi:hypothetical protein
MRDKKTIFKIKHGSHLYGTNTETSDLDLKEVHLPSGRDIVLQRAKKAYDNSKPKEHGAKNTADDVDIQSFSVHKLCEMLFSGDIIGMEMIYAPPQNIIFKDPLYDIILDNKNIFLSRKVDGYVGYCRQQANKYGIRGSRVAAVREVLEVLEYYENISPKEKLGELYGVLQNLADSVEHCSIESIPNGAHGTHMLHFVCCDRKVPYTITIENACKIYRRVYNEYGDRAKQAETNQGIDWKALSHAIRVGEQAIELLSTNQITFPRPNADRLLSIKRGEVPYKAIADELDKLLTDVEEASTQSSLPERADVSKIEELIVELYRQQVIGD